MNKVSLVGISVALVLFVMASLPWFSDKEQLTASQKLAQEKAFEVEIAQLTSRYLEDNQALLTEFENSLANIGASDFQLARKNIVPTVKNLTGFGTTSKLCYKMAKDIMCDSQDTQDALEEVIVPNIITPCENGNTKINNELNIFLLKLEESHNSYCADLALAINNSSVYDGNSKAREDFLNTNMQALNSIKDIATNKAAITLGLAVEGLFFKSTLRALSATCASVVSRIVTSTSAAGVAAVADGPLPIGDIIGATVFVGGMVWCSYDIYKVQKVLPAELKTTLTRAVTDCEKNAKAEAIKIAYEAVNSYNNVDKIQGEE